MKLKFSLFLVLLLLSALSAEYSVAEVNSVRISSRLDPNAIIITEVDIIFIYDQAIADNFPTAKSQWYSGKRRFTREAGDAVDIVNIFIPQGFDSVTATLPERKADAVRVVVFGYHDDSKAAPVDIHQWQDVAVEIDPFGIVVSSLD